MAGSYIKRKLDNICPASEPSLWLYRKFGSEAGQLLAIVAGSCIKGKLANFWPWWPEVEIGGDFIEIDQGGSRMCFKVCNGIQ